MSDQPSPEEIFLQTDGDTTDLTPEQIEVGHRVYVLYAFEGQGLADIYKTLRDEGTPLSISGIRGALSAFAAWKRADSSMAEKYQIALDQQRYLLGVLNRKFRDMDETGEGLKQVEATAGPDGKITSKKVKTLSAARELASLAKTISDVGIKIAMLEGLTSRQNENDAPSKIEIDLMGFVGPDEDEE